MDSTQKKPLYAAQNNFGHTFGANNKQRSSKNYYSQVNRKKFPNNFEKM